MKLKLIAKITLFVLLFSGLCANAQKTTLEVDVAKTITKIQISAPEKWLLTTNSGSQLNATLCPDSYVSRLIVILNFKVSQKKLKLAVIISAESVDPETVRQLRTYLFNS